MPRKPYTSRWGAVLGAMALIVIVLAIAFHPNSQPKDEVVEETSPSSPEEVNHRQFITTARRFPPVHIWTVKSKTPYHYDSAPDTSDFHVDYYLRNETGETYMWRACANHPSFNTGDELIIVAIENPPDTHIADCFTQVYKITR